MSDVTTHELARELLELPDVRLVVEGWCGGRDSRIYAVMSGFDSEGTAILVQRVDGYFDRIKKGEA